MTKEFSNQDSIDRIIDMAVALCQKHFSDSEIAEVLNGDDDVQKCIAVMNVKKITSQILADLIIFHLTNHGGTIREAVAIKLDSLFDHAENVQYFQNDTAVNTICDAIVDINPNISRIIIELLNKLNNKQLVLDNINAKINFALENIMQCEVLQNHQINKFYFKIYWLLEALYKLNCVNISAFLPVLKKITELPEYTVREKVAQLVKKYDELEELKERLQNDENYYVKRVLQ